MHLNLHQSASAPLLPPLFLLRAARRAWRDGTEAKQLLLAAPLVLLAMTGWAWGEMSGYLGAWRRAEPRTP